MSPIVMKQLSKCKLLENNMCVFSDTIVGQELKVVLTLNLTALSLKVVLSVNAMVMFTIAFPGF